MAFTPLLVHSPCLMFAVENVISTISAHAACCHAPTSCPHPLTHTIVAKSQNILFLLYVAFCHSVLSQQQKNNRYTNYLTMPYANTS